MSAARSLRSLPVLLLAATFLLIQPSSAATFTVTNTSDAGAGSLRQTIIDANALAGADVIQFDTAGVFGTAQTITLTSGSLPLITNSLEIIGPSGVGQDVTLSGNNLYRIFLVQWGAPGSFTLRNLQLLDGAHATQAGAVTANGTNAVTLTLENCRFTSNSGHTGGAVYCNTTNQSSVTMTGCVFDANSSSPIAGGGLYVKNATVVLASCIFTSNTTANSGGGIFCSLCPSVSMTGCTFSGNAAGSTGGAVNFDQCNSAAVSSTVFTGNTSSNTAGGLTVRSTTLALRDCTISGNAAAGTIGGGILTSGTTLLQAENCTLSGNTAADYGGGIEHQGSVGMTLVNCTVSGNTSGTQGGGIHVPTPGLNALLINCTVTANSATGSCGGVYLHGSGTMTLGNTIIAGNTSAGTIPDINGTPTSLGHNLIGINDSSIADGVNGDLAGSTASPVNPLLGPLANNGGQTFTHALLPGSPAIDAGDSALVTAPPFTGPAFVDQTGNPRIRGVVDIGAIETTATSIVTNTNDSGPGSLRDAVTSGASTIVFDPAVFAAAAQTITLTSGELTIAASTSIIAPAVGVIISGGGTSRVCRVTASGLTTMRRLLFLNGSASDGAGLKIETGASVLLDTCGVQLCSATGSGGAVWVGGGTLQAVNSICWQNTAAVNGGGIAVVNGTLKLANFTLAANAANESGGGLHTDQSTVRLVNVSITGNGADFDNNGSGDGGGIWSGAAAYPNVGNTVISSNTDAGGQAPDIAGGFTSLGHNLIRISNGQNAAVGTPFSHGVNGDIVGTTGTPVNPLLSALAMRGGLLPTRTPQATSPLIDSGDAMLLSDSAWPETPQFDQRGQFRIVQGSLDIGACEYPDGSVAKIEVADGIAAENGREGIGWFRVIRSLPSGAAPVFFTLDGAATVHESDFNLSGVFLTTPGVKQWQVAFNGSVRERLVLLTAFNDNLEEPDEICVPQLATSPGYFLDHGSVSSRTITLISDDLLVTTNSDSGTGSLRGALTQALAKGSARIRFDEAGFFSTPRSITLASALPAFTGHRLDLAGPAALSRRVLVRGNHAFPLLVCTPVSAESLSVRNLSFSDGEGGIVITNDGGTVDLEACSVTSCENDGHASVQIEGADATTISNCIVDQNTTVTDGVAGISLRGGSALIERSAITRNASAYDAGGLVSMDQQLVVRNCTLSGNSVNIGGGAVLLGEGSPGTASALFDHCTITANHSATGDNTANPLTCGGIAKDTGHVCEIRATIVSGNTGGALHAASDLRADLISGGHNLVGSVNGASGITDGVNNDEIGLDPRLGVLRNNGGGTLTHALLPGSPAVNAASPTGAPIADQRQAARDATPDIGAYEASLESYAYWAEHEFGGAPLSGFTDDFDGDGITNGIEYLTGTDPTAPASQPRLRPRKQGGQFIVQFDRSSLVSPDQIVIMISTDLVNWTSLTYPTGRTLGGPSTNVVAGWLEEFAMSPPVEGRLFVRIAAAP